MSSFSIKTAISSPQAWLSLITFVVLLLAWIVGFSSRLFAVIRFESIIHEFDPWFNYRATKYMVENGFYNFLNWFDERAWYPLGRIVGGTVYPGLMITSGAIHYILHFLHIPVHIQDVCVFLAPVFSGLTAIATYLLTKELWTPAAGLLAACFIAIVPGYISRSVAGSYDNEGIAIFALMFTYYLWIKSMKSGSVSWSILTALSYFYMVSAWGGYVYIINLIPLHVFVLLVMGRYNVKLYTAYTTFYIVGLILSMEVPFVGFQPLRTSEHMAAAGVFVLLNIYNFVQYLRIFIPKNLFKKLFTTSVIVGAASVFANVVILTYLGYIAPWSGRFYSLWDTGYAKIHIPIIVSVSEHQPTTWCSFFFDNHVLLCIFPAGLWFVFKKLTDERVFIILFAMSAVYFAGVMVRLMLTLTPVICVLASVAFSTLFDQYLKDEAAAPALDAPTTAAKRGVASLLAPLEDYETEDLMKVTGKSTLARELEPATSSSSEDGSEDKNGGRGKKVVVGHKGHQAPSSTSPSSKRNLYDKAGKIPKINPSFLKSDKDDSLGLNIKGLTVLVLVLLLLMFAVHSTWVTSNAYSSPSVVLASYGSDGERYIIDDFREAYYWLSQNTPDDATVMSWWDYGYQIAGMGNKTTLVDNNTWNNSHIALVGKAMSSNESAAYDIAKMLGVNYVLVIFGGVIGFSGDDINKFLWMVRIAEGEHPKDIREQDYFTANGEFRVDNEGSPTLLNCLMYKLSYYNFGKLKFDYRMPYGYDRTRDVEIGNKNFDLTYFEEAYTTGHWLVRIYKVKDEINRVPKIPQIEKAPAKRYPKKVGKNKKGSVKNKLTIIKNVGTPQQRIVKK